MERQKDEKKKADIQTRIDNLEKQVQKQMGYAEKAQKQVDDLYITQQKRYENA
jgi:hypothetical protein